MKKAEASDEIEFLIKLFDEKIVELHKTVGGISARHAFLLYRKIAWSLEKYIKGKG